MSEYGVLSIVPPLLAIVLAIVTRQAVLSLFLGVWVGGIIDAYGQSIELAGPILGPLVSIPWGLARGFEWIVQAIGDSTFHAEILVFTMLLGSGIAFIWRIGGSVAVARYATERLDTQRKVGIATWLLGLVWFFDDYANTAIVGSSMRDISDEMRISREKLSYIIDSTAAPVATFGISSWVAFQISMIEAGYEAAGIADTAPSSFRVFLQSIPFNLYCLLALIMVAIVVITRRDFGEMLDAESRSRTTGKVLRDDATPLQSMEGGLGEPGDERPMLRMFIVPVLVLITVVVFGAVWTGYAPGRSLIEIADNTAFTSALIWGSFAMVASAAFLGVYYGVLSLDETMDTLIDGFGIMLNAIAILILAWSIGAVAEALGTGEYVTGIAEGVITPTLLPVVILVAAAFISFSIGTSWGTMGLVTPVAVPLAWEIGGGSTEMLAVAVGAVFSGAIFGDHTSPISDTTVLSSTFTGADHIDHVRTQLYYAVTVALVASLLYVIWGVTGTSPLVLIPIGIVVLVGLVYGLSELDASRKGVSPKPEEVPTGGPSDD